MKPALQPALVLLLAWNAAPAVGAEPEGSPSPVERRAAWLEQKGAHVEFVRQTPQPKAKPPPAGSPFRIPAGIDDDRAFKPPIKHVILDESWRGGDEGLDKIEWLAKRQPNFFNLYLVGEPSVSQERLAQLRKAAPQLAVHRRSAAVLGIAASPVSGAPCKVRRVVAGSAADEAGVRKGDIIIHFDDKPARDFDRLIALLRSKEPGDTAPLVVRRDGRPVQIDVKLKRWDHRVRGAPP